MAKMSHQDFARYHHNTVAYYKGDLVHIITSAEAADGVERVQTARVKNGQRVVAVEEMEIDGFEPVTDRIGNVNVHGKGVVYVVRIPARRFHRGLHPDILKTSSLIGRATYEDSRNITGLANLPSLFDAIQNKYPSLRQAADRVSQKQGVCCAFDKQFSVDSDRQIYYRDKVVGALPRGKSKIEDIVLAPDFQHLEILLTGQYEKTVRTFGIA